MSAGVRRAAAPVIVDAAALQSPTSRGRGIARYAEQWILALEEQRPDLVRAYLLDDALAPPAISESLLATGKVVSRQSAGDPFEGARLLHSLSALDIAIPIETIWPRAAHEHSLARSATVYDLIPALEPERELADALVRRRYHTRLELARSLDQVHAISASVARDVVRLLGLADEQVTTVGAAPGGRFSPDRGPIALAPAAVLLGSLKRPFVLVPGGSHPRKNTERLLKAWGKLPAKVRARHRLVVTGAVNEPTAHHYRYLAERLGFADGLVVAGEVSDETLVSLYRGAKLVCYPSLAEGYGLPVAEAIACRTPVIASDRPPLDELLKSAARFEPSKVATIASALASALSDERRLAAIGAATRRPSTFAEVAARSAAAFDDLLATRPTGGSPRPAPLRGSGTSPGPRRRRLAFVSPFPPSPTGVAAYSYRLVEELLATGEVDVDAYLDGPTSDQVVPEGAGVHRAGALVVTERLLGTYDAVCYSLGNSHYHLGALADLRRRGGAVISHDVRMTNAYRFAWGDPALPSDRLGRVVREMYDEPGLPDRLDEGTPGHLLIDRSGFLMAREAISCSERFLVSSPAAAELARLDARAVDVAKVAVLDFAVEDPAAHAVRFAADGSHEEAPEMAGEGPLLVHFGIVDPVKLPEVLLEATSLLLPRFPDLRCAFVGPIARPFAKAMRAQAEALGCRKALVLAGALGPKAYRAALERATVAVQLRAGFNGEASSAIGECLASGVPTVVSQVGWARDLPEEAVVALESPVTAATLADVLGDLLDDEARRAALGAAARRYAGEHTFAATARRLLEVLFGSPRAPGNRRRIAAGSRAAGQS